MVANDINHVSYWEFVKRGIADISSQPTHVLYGFPCDVPWLATATDYNDSSLVAM